MLKMQRSMQQCEKRRTISENRFRGRDADREMNESLWNQHFS